MTDPVSPAPAPGGPPSADPGHPRKWWILIVVSFGMFMALLDVTIVNIAMPAIITDLDTTVAQASWVLNSYNLVLAVFFLSMGRVADRYGQKRVFIFGLVTFTIFSLLCGFAPNIEWLVAFRAGQGLGGAALLTISLAIVLGVFPKRQQGAAVGIWGALGTAAAAVGPALGGVLVTYGDWSWIFFVNVPIGVVAVVVCAWVIPRGERKPAAEGGIDIPGMVISGAGLFCLTLALVEGDTWGWTSATVIALFVAAAVSFPLFMWWETSTASPMFPVSLLRIRSFTAANTAILFVGVAMGGTFLMLVIFLVSVLGFSELRAALAMTIMPVLALIVAPTSGVGMASAQDSREATRAPAALAKSRTWASGQPDSSPWQKAPPKESPAPRPLTVSTGTGADTTRSVRVLAITPSGPSFTTAISTPAASSRSACSSGVPSPTATAHSLSLPIATVTCGRILATCSRASASEAQNIGR